VGLFNTQCLPLRYPVFFLFDPPSYHAHSRKPFRPKAESSIKQLRPLPTISHPRRVALRQYRHETNHFRLGNTRPKPPRCRMHTSVHPPLSMERIRRQAVIQVSSARDIHWGVCGVCVLALLTGHCHTGTENLNQWFTHGDVGYILICSAMVLIMVPGLGFLYSGLARRKSALSLIWACVGSSVVVTFQWYFWGYSLAFSKTATNGYIGNLKHFALQNTLAVPSPGSPLIPELLYSFYQMQFAAVTVAIVVGAIAERGRLLPAMVFTFFWATIVYCPVACWVWNINGWAFKYGVLDYAGRFPNRWDGVFFARTNSRCRWWARRNCVRCWCTRLLHGSRKASREDAPQFPTTQRLFDHSRYLYSLVRLARIQRRICLWRQSPCCHSLLEQQLDCDRVRSNLGSSGFPSC
jgi:hypothetical protein